MPSKYPKAELPEDGRAIYNAVVKDTPALQAYGLTYAKPGDAPTGIGTQIIEDLQLQNIFIPALLNKIAVTILMSKVWNDPWASLEKGKIELGEIVQEVFIKMAKPKTFDQKRAETEVFKREFADVETAFHKLNYQKYYKQTISAEELRAAFLSWDAFQSFIDNLIQNMYTSAAYDTNMTKRYMIARALLDGRIATAQIPALSDTTAKSIIAKARGISNLMNTWLNDYNYFHVPNTTEYGDQVIIINAMAEGLIDVEVLAAAFNMSKAEFLSMHKLIVPGFGQLDIERLGQLFAGDSTYREPSQAELDALDEIPFAIFDRKWFQIYDYFNGMANIYNPEGLYWNYDYHVWKIFGMSPFSNAVAFVPGASGVKSVTVSPSTATLTRGQSLQMSANVTTDWFASKEVYWISNNGNVTVNEKGLVTAANSASGTATITARARADQSKSASATITIA